MDQSYVGEILLRRGVVNEGRLEEALRVAEEKGAALTDVVVDGQMAEASAVLKALAEEVGLDSTTEIKADDVPPELIDATPIGFARQHQVLPIAENDGVVLVAVADPLDPSPLDDLRVLLGKPVDAVVAPTELIDSVINQVYERKEEDAHKEGVEVGWDAGRGHGEPSFPLLRTQVLRVSANLL